jgi:sec-independent protein translocase protein TatA
MVIALVVFGPGKLPEIGSALGKGIRDFKKSFDGKEDDDAKKTDRGQARASVRQGHASLMMRTVGVVLIMVAVVLAGAQPSVARPLPVHPPHSHTGRTFTPLHPAGTHPLHPHGGHPQTALHPSGSHALHPHGGHSQTPPTLHPSTHPLHPHGGHPQTALHPSGTQPLHPHGGHS